MDDGIKEITIEGDGVITFRSCNEISTLLVYTDHGGEAHIEIPKDFFNRIKTFFNLKSK